MPSLDRLHKPVLVLNASYEPINVCAARRALVLVLKGVASAEELSQSLVHSSRQAVPMPSVIRLLEYRRIPHQTRALSRKNILMRVRCVCQFCHKRLLFLRLFLDDGLHRTDDHVGVTTLEFRLSFHRADLRKILCKPQQQFFAQVDMRDFASTELHHGLHAISFLEEAHGVVLLELV